MTTDVIVGFPGETDEDFADTLNLMEIVRYDAAFTFAYSPAVVRRNKNARQVPEVVSKERLQRLNALQTRISLERNQQLVGAEQEILVEGLARMTRENLLAAPGVTSLSICG